MSERYTRLFSLPENLYAEGSPVVIAAGALLKDNKTGKILSQLKLRNIQQKEIKAATISLMPLDTLGNPLGEAISHQYLDLTVRWDQDFGQKTPIPMPDATTRSFAVTVEKVVFPDLTTWTSAGNTWDKLQEPRYLSSLYDLDLVQQFRMEYGTDCINQLLEEKDVWHCVCGALNKREESNFCYKCGKSLASLQAIDMEAMQRRKDERIAQERKEAAEAAQRRAVESKIRRKKALIVGAATILLVAVAMMIRPAIIRAMDYKNAVALLNQGNYEDAIAAFEELGDYKDAPTKKDGAIYQKNQVTYQKAMTLFQEKKYEKAIEVFRTIIDFEDSEQQILNVQNAILEEKYVNAFTLLEEGSDQEAYEAFVELGNYKDAQSMRSRFIELPVREEYRSDNGRGSVYDYSYDDLGRVSIERSLYKELYTIKEYTYDEFGNVSEIKYSYEPQYSFSEAKPKSSNMAAVKYFYDSNNHMIRSEEISLNERTHVTLYQWYNENGECICDGVSGFLSKDESAEGHVYTIDAKGNIIQDTGGTFSWDGTFPGSDWHTYTYTYDASGNILVEKYAAPSSYYSGTYTKEYKYEYYKDGRLSSDGYRNYYYRQEGSDPVYEAGCTVFLAMVYAPNA